MARKTSNKSVTCVPMTDLEDILISLPGVNLDEARAMLVMRARAARRAERVASFKAAKIVERNDDADSLVFPKRDTRRSSEVSDHTSRLSVSSSDSDAMKEFLATGGSITVLPTRNAKGFSQSNKIRVAGGSRTNSLAKSRNAHSKVLHDAKHDAILASMTKPRS